MSEFQTFVDDLLGAGSTVHVGGQWRSVAETIELNDPANPSSSTGQLAAGSSADVSDAYEAAEAARLEWATTPAQARSDVLRKAADLLEAETHFAARRLTLDMGKAIRDATAEVFRGVAILRYYAGEVLQAAGEVYPSVDPQTSLHTIEEPVGTVALITPWNFPTAIPLWKMAPALVFGNTVVWKPASDAGGSAVLLVEVLRRAGLPGGVLNMVTGHGRELSGSITSAPSLGALSFTGSGGTGMNIQAALADRTVKLQLELGGKNPAIVLADADLEDAAIQICRGAMFSTGQRCTATSRVFVEAAAAEEFTDLLVKQVDALRVGDPMDPATNVGPVASKAQFETVSSYLDLAREEGTSFLTGGESAGEAEEGFFIQPTVLTGVDPSSRLVREEIFGPVLCLVTVEGGFEEMVELANDTEFGLSSALFTSNLKDAMRFSRLSESGVVHVNRETAGVEPHVPFGGLKSSSNAHREQGTAARRFFTNTKTVYIRTP
ncbi:MAG: aldehyde dehydrogenase family protein [Actinomycetota bacterium]|nr:aldehyde dehydrogenase family protein [Actinomycetota bacterium]